MRRHLGHPLCIAAVLVLAACAGDDDSASDSSAPATELVDASGVTAETTPDESADATEPTQSTAAGAATTASVSTTTTAVDSTGTTVADSTGSTVAGSPGTTVAAADTTAAPSTTSAFPTSVAELTLLADGVGPLRFGSDGDTVILTVSAVLLPPISDAPVEYPVAAADGRFTSVDLELAWAQPFGRTVCWANGFCGEFGGTTAGPYTFLGWFYAATDVHPMAAPSGLSVGSTLAEFADVITVSPGGCYSVGYGTADGVSLAMQSSGEPFVNVDEAGNETPGSPDPADVTIVQMQAGEQVTYLFGDC